MHTHRAAPSLSTNEYRGPKINIGCSSSAEQADLESQAAIRGSSIGKGEGTPCKKKVKRVSKRRSRAVAKPPIRVLSANKSTFRDLVFYFTGNPSSSSSPPPPYPNPSLPSSYPHLDALLSLTTNSPLSFPNPLSSQSHSLSFANSFPNPISSLSTSQYSTSPPSSDGASFHSSPYPLLNTPPHDPTLIQSENKFQKTLEFLQALKQSLLHIKSLGECGSFNFGLLHDTISNNGSDLKPLLRSKVDHTPKSTNTYGIDDVDLKSLLSTQVDYTPERTNTYGIDGVDLKPLLRTQVDHTPKLTNTYVGDRMVHMKSLDMEHLQHLQQVEELENFLLTRDDKLDDLFTSNFFHNVKS